jgi:aryl-alcohol dehydrogenase-like predicted oxidoreductase
MDKIHLGKTEIMVSRSGFGALPIQRVSKSESVKILRKAVDNGINFFDTARAYSDSEEKLGDALFPVRKQIIIATKTPALTKKNLLNDLKVSLEKLRTDYIDILQLHNPEILPDVNDPEGAYEGLLQARKEGLIRFVGITNHKLKTALEAVRSGLYDTVQFPLSPLSSEAELELIPECKEYDCGLIAMKALCGGLITNASTAFAFLRQYDNLLPIWGIQKEAELDEFIRFEKCPPVLEDNLKKIIEKDRKELSGKFCRGCGYCLPCPSSIQINWVARMSLLLRRAPYRNFLTDDWRDRMLQINKCTGCGNCKSKCPYGLNTPDLLKANLEDYELFYKDHASEIRSQI